MMPCALFQLSIDQRRSFIERHSFFVEQAKKRLLGQFEDLEGDADRAAEEWLETQASRFDPDRHDPGDFEERAYFHSVEVYLGLVELREQAKLLVVAGMYHQWEKQLKEWHIQELRHWNPCEELKREIWRVDFGKVMDLWEHLGWVWKQEVFYSGLNAGRLVTNVHKHGAGASLEELKLAYPQFLLDPLKEYGGGLLGPSTLDYRQLQVTVDQIDQFSDAIVEFWRRVPKEVLDTQVVTVPDWFGKAALKGSKAHTRVQP